MYEHIFVSAYAEKIRGLHSSVFIRCLKGTPGAMEQHQEAGDQHQAAGGASAGKRGGKHPSKTRRV